MSFFLKNRSWFSRLNPFARRGEQTASWRQAASRPSFRPSLEALEQRLLPTVDFYGGPVIPHVEVNTLFVGQQWQSGSLSDLSGGLNGYLQTLVNSPYMDMLSQYNVERGSFGQSANDYFNNDPNMQSPMNDNNQSYPGGLTELQYLIVNCIQAHVLPTPNQNQLYVVFLPPGEQETAPGGQMNNGFYAYHDSFNSQYGTIYYAVAPFPGDGNPIVPPPNYFDTMTEFDSLTEAVSHELSEAVTDPLPYKSWYDPQMAQTPQGGEIGDIVNLQYVYWNGYVVQKEANQQDQGMIPPLPSAAVQATAMANQTFNGPVMNFTDHSTTVFGDTTAQPLGGSPLSGSSFWVTINWGDGQTSAGQVVYTGNGQYSVIGSHSYAQQGTYQISVSATDPYGVTASNDSTLTVAPDQLVPSPPPSPPPPPVLSPPPPPPPQGVTTTTGNQQSSTQVVTTTTSTSTETLQQELVQLFLSEIQAEFDELSQLLAMLSAERF